MRLLLTLMIWVGLYLSATSQQWAGPDVDVCEQGDLKQLGSNDPCIDCCYSWSPSTGLSCTDCKNPYVNAKDTTIYTVEVRDKYLRLLGRDEVKVNVVFGNIHFTPGYLIQGSEDTVEATILTLSNSFDPGEIYWNFSSDDLGCSMDVGEEGNTAWIAPGNTYGTVYIEAIYTGANQDGMCMATAALDVNNGVKDVWAIDHTQPGRIAKNGGTLIVLNDTIVDISAKPNEGGFAPNIPDWKPDIYGSTTPSDGQANVATSEVPDLAGKISQYIAGEEPADPPEVTVIRRTRVSPWEQPISIPGMDTLDKLIKSYFTFLDTPPIAPCGSVAPFSLSLSLPALGYTISEVEKYNDPGLGLKKVLKIPASVTATGKIFHPAFTKTFSFHAFGVDIFLCSRLYAELTGSMEVNMEFVSSDSLPDSAWKASDPQITAGFGIGGNLEFAFLPQGYLVTASASIKSKLQVIFTYVNETSILNHKIKVDPATAILQAKIQQETDPGKFKDLLGGRLNFSKEIVLLKGGEYGPWKLHQF